MNVELQITLLAMSAFNQHRCFVNILVSSSGVIVNKAKAKTIKKYCLKIKLK